MKPLIRLLLATVPAALGLSPGALARELRFTIRNLPPHPPVAIPVTGRVAGVAAPGVLQITADGGEVSLPAQLAAGLGGSKPEVCVFVLPDRVSSARKALTASPVSTAHPVFRFTEDAGQGVLSLTENHRPVLNYCFGMQLKPGVPPDRRRACYVHPVFGLDGEVLTDDFPKDHYHHRGLFWAWPLMRRGNQAFSLWDLRVVQQRFDRWLNRETGPACAQFGVQNGWYQGKTRIAEEEVWLRVWRAGPVGRAVDVWLQWTALDQPISIHGQTVHNKGYGGFNFRFGPRVDTRLSTPTGPAAKDVVYGVFPWADLSARFRGADGLSGGAVFGNSANPRFPDAWLLRHYGFLGVCWPGRETVALQPGKPVHVQYRVWIHRGDVAAGHVADAYQVYAAPPVIERIGAAPRQ